MHVSSSRAVTPLQGTCPISSVQAGVIIFAALSVFFVYWPAARLFIPLEINRNEAWNAWFTDSAINGPRLYPGPNELIVNNYPPLSFYVVGILSKLTGDVIYAGRIVALLSSGVASFAVALCARNLGASWIASALGGFWFLATMGAFAPSYVAMNDPAMLALALMGLGLAVSINSMRTGSRIELATAIMVLAGFVKYNVIGIPIAVFLWLALSDRRRAVEMAVFGLFLALAGLGICVAVYGSNFIDQLLAPRVASIMRAIITAGRLQWVAPALVFWGLWAWRNRHDLGARFSALLIAVAILTSLLQRSVTGVSVNAFFEVIFVTGIAVSLTFQHIAETPLAARWGADHAGWTLTFALLLGVLISGHKEPYLALLSNSFKDDVASQVRDIENHIRQVEAMPGPVVCTNLTVCYRAHKEWVYDRFWMEQFVAKHARSENEIRETVAKTGIRFENGGVEIPMDPIREAH